VLIGVDVGCTTLSGSLVTPDGNVLSAIQAPTSLGSGTAVHTILGIVADLHAEAQAPVTVCHRPPGTSKWSKLTYEVSMGEPSSHAA